MPLMDYSDGWTPQQLDADIAKAYAESGADWTKAAGILNEKYKWSMNKFDVRAYVQDKHPDLYAAWKAKYGSFFKMSPMVMIVGSGVALMALGWFMMRKRAQ